MKTIIYTVLGFAVLTPALASACFGDFGIRYGMMGGYYYGDGMATLMVAGGLVWVIVGILAGVWLWQNINKK